MTGRAGRLVAAVALCATAACGADPLGDDATGDRTDTVSSDQPASPTPGDPSVLSIGLATAREGERVTVRGWLVDDGGTTVLAAMLAESYPPQAGGDTLVVADPRIGDDVTLESASGVRWSAEQVLVTGVVRDGELRDAAVRSDASPGEAGG